MTRKMRSEVLSRIQEAGEIPVQELWDSFPDIGQTLMNQIISHLLDEGKIQYGRYLRTVIAKKLENNSEND